MRFRTGKRRGSVLVALVAVVAVLAMFTPASAAQSFIVAGPGNSALPYYTPFVVLQKGQALTFVNLDIPLHDVKSGTPLTPTGKFSAAAIGIGKRTPVIGAKKLAKGSYKFFCSFHPAMKGTLRVI
jgi:plastocyanin